MLSYIKTLLIKEETFTDFNLALFHLLLLLDFKYKWLKFILGIIAFLNPLVSIIAMVSRLLISDRNLAFLVIVDLTVKCTERMFCNKL